MMEETAIVFEDEYIVICRTGQGDPGNIKASRVELRDGALLFYVGKAPEETLARIIAAGGWTDLVRVVKI